MQSDFDLIMSRDIDLLRLRYEAHVRRHAKCYVNDNPDLVYELTQRTFDLVSTASFAGPFAYRHGHPTVKAWVTQQLFEAWSAMSKEKQTRPTTDRNTPTSRQPIQGIAEDCQCSFDTDTSRF